MLTGEESEARQSAAAKAGKDGRDARLLLGPGLEVRTGTSMLDAESSAAGRHWSASEARDAPLLFMPNVRLGDDGGKDHLLKGSNTIGESASF